MTEIEQIEKDTDTPRVECACNKCKSMCQTAPCMGTPADILKLIEAGYADRLAITAQLAFLPHGLPAITLISPKFEDDKGCCTFYKDGLCELHESGLKPTEGKLATHEFKEYDIKKSPPFVVAERWRTDYENVRKVLMAFGKYSL